MTYEEVREHYTPAMALFGHFSVNFAIKALKPFSEAREYLVVDPAVFDEIGATMLVITPKQ